MALNDSHSLEHESMDVDNFTQWTMHTAKRTLPLYIDIVEVFLSILGMVCNVITCCAFKLRLVKWNTRSKLVCSLCVADFLVAESHFVQHVFDVTTPIFNLLKYDLYNVHLEEPILYVVQTILYNYAQTVQQILMICLAVDLLIAVKHPLHYTRLMSTRRGTTLVACSWILSFICVLLQEFASLNSSLTLAILFVVPVIDFVVLGIIYSIVFCEIRKHRDRSPRTVNLRKSAMTFGIICVTYVTCMMPVSWIMVMHIASKLANSTLIYLYQILKCLFVVNTVCDPIVYAWRLPDLNSVIEKVFKRCPCGHRNEPSAGVNATGVPTTCTHVMESTQ